jgi:hypothetical protein
VTSRAQFAYAQARLQARHGQRPGEQVWRQLEGTGDLANYLHTLHRSALRHWIPGSDGTHGSHDLELSLRRQFRSYVDEIASWLPAEWRASATWISRLPDLPALLHLLKGNTAPAWLLDDPSLEGFASENSEVRQEAFKQSDCADLAAAWHAGKPLTHAWIEKWFQLLPGKAGKDAGIIQVGRLFREQLVQPDTLATTQRRARLEQQLTSLFRRCSFQAPASYAHLGLTALDLERIRSGLAVRANFPSMQRPAS